MLVNVVVPGLYGGVSQQAPSFRLETQGEAQENFRSSLTEGLARRFPTNFIGHLENSKADSNSYVHFAEDAYGSFFIVVTTDPTSPVEAYTIDGVKLDIEYDWGTQAYVTAGGSALNPKKEIKMITVQDTTFLLNRNVTCEMDEDSLLSGTYKGIKASFTKLPETGMVDGDVWQIREEDSYTAYWVKWNATEGVWEEWGKPGIKDSFDNTTLPIKIIRTAEDTFSVQYIDYDKRLVGDETSNPEPSFVGSTLTNLFFYQNRLCFLSQDNMICSRTGLYFDFWRGTVLDLLDDHPIDVSATAASKQAPLLFDVSAFDDNILLFSTTNQFSVNNTNNIFSPKTISITPTTAYETHVWSNVLAAGPCVYFVTKRGNYAAIREYYNLSDVITNQANEVTSHVPSYVPAGVIKGDISNSLNLIAYHSSDAPFELFIYEYFWEQDSKLQSSWHKWVFKEEVLNFFIDNTYLYLIQKAEVDGRVFLSVIDMNQYAEGSNQHPVYLDKLFSVQGVYDEEKNMTFFDSPYPILDTSGYILVSSEDGLPLYEIEYQKEVLATSDGVPITTSDGEYICASGPQSFAIEGDYSKYPVFCGSSYNSKYRFSKLYLKQGQEGSKRAFIEGKLVIRTLTLSYTTTGYFRVNIINRDREPFVHEFSGAQLNINKLDQATTFSEERKMLVGGQSVDTAIEIETDSHFPASFQSATYEATYNTKTNNRM